MLDDDSCDDGSTSRCLLAALWTISRHITTPQSASVRHDLAVLHDIADGGSTGAVSLLPRPPTWHLLGLVCCNNIITIIKIIIIITSARMYRVVQKNRGHSTFVQISRKLQKIIIRCFAHAKATVY